MEGQLPAQLIASFAEEGGEPQSERSMDQRRYATGVGVSGNLTNRATFVRMNVPQTLHAFDRKPSRLPTAIPSGLKDERVGSVTSNDLRHSRQRY